MNDDFDDRIDRAVKELTRYWLRRDKDMSVTCNEMCNILLAMKSQKECNHDWKNNSGYVNEKESVEEFICSKCKKNKVVTIPKQSGNEEIKWPPYDPRTFPDDTDCHWTNGWNNCHDAFMKVIRKNKLTPVKQVSDLKKDKYFTYHGFIAQGKFYIDFVDGWPNKIVEVSADYDVRTTRKVSVEEMAKAIYASGNVLNGCDAIHKLVYGDQK